jgi:hypothetical protein
VEKHPFGLICHLPEWKEVLEQSFPHMKGHYIALVNDQDNSIRAALPVFEVKSILTGNRLVSIPFATNCDPLISSDEDMRILLDAAIKLSEKLKCSLIELRALASTPLINDARIGSVVNNKSHQLMLAAGPDEIIKTFNNQVKRKLKICLKTDLECKIADKETDIREFYNLYVKTRKRLGLPPQPHLFFKLLWQKLSISGYISLLLVRDKGQLVAGLIMFKFKNRCSWDYLASDSKFNHLHINYLVLWEAIKLACSEGYEIFDFGRTGINNKGLMNFKRQWGTTVVDLPQFYYPEKVCTGFECLEESISYKLIRQVGRNVPEPVFRRMGDFMYKHMG